VRRGRRQARPRAGQAFAEAEQGVEGEPRQQRAAGERAPSGARLRRAGQSHEW
jgi:hypothetical protein